MTKKGYKQACLSNLVTFVRWDGVKDEKCQYYGSSLKSPIFKGFIKTNISGGIA